jgi:hypothetical protein
MVACAAASMMRHLHLGLKELPPRSGRIRGTVTGWLERSPRGGLKVRLVPTEAGRTAAALLSEGLLDVVLSGDYPPTVGLTESDW